MVLRAAPQAGKDDVRNLSGVHPFDGARVANILPGTADELGIEEQEGVVILQVRPESRAARIGFQPGDVIQQVGARRSQTVSELEAALKERQQVWQMVLKRGNQTIGCSWQISPSGVRPSAPPVTGFVQCIRV